jgi:iron complex transport system substrate-binding protein
MVRRAGGVDVMAEAGTHSRQYTARDVKDSHPDIVIFAPCGYDLARSANEGERLLDSPEWEWLRDRRSWAMDGNALTSRPGPRLCIGVEVMARIFNPQLFGPVAVTSARSLTPA